MKKEIKIIFITSMLSWLAFVSAVIFGEVFLIKYSTSITSHLNTIFYVSLSLMFFFVILAVIAFNSIKNKATAFFESKKGL